MIALLLVLASSPLDPLWVLVDEERYDSAISGALQVAQNTSNPEKLRQSALSLALNAACSGRAQRCDEIARVAADWSPLWRPDSRAQPQLVQAVGRARLSRNSRHSRLSKGNLEARRWCAQESASELLLIANRAGISERRRQTGSCIDIAGIGDGYIVRRLVTDIKMSGEVEVLIK